ncbi:MAG: TolC family protein, partial [Acinetobacter sp.]
MQKAKFIFARSFAVSALALALTACQSMRGPEPVAKPEIPNQFAAKGASGTSIAEQGYKEFFSDPRLTQVIDLALQNNRDLRTAALNIQKAQLQYHITELNQLPTVGADASYTRAKTPTSSFVPFSLSEVTVGVTSYELDFWGRVRSLKDAA